MTGDSRAFRRRDLSPNVSATRTYSSVEVTDRHALRNAFGTFATGVTVLTVGGPIPHGMTANSFTSVSLDPALVLVCVGHDAVMHRLLTAAGSFGISVLAGDQEAAAKHFADRSRAPGASEFDAVGWRPGRLTEVPLIEGALAWFECEMWRTYDGGDHSIFVGRLLSADLPAELDPLLFHCGRLSRLSPELDEMPT